MEGPEHIASGRKQTVGKHHLDSFLFCLHAGQIGP